MKSLLGVLALWTLVGLLVGACGGASSTPKSAVAELQQIAPVKQGEPILVFVYTDG